MEIPEEHYKKNDEGLAKLKDIHAGRRAFVIGNGPSLRISDLDRLKDEITFASNKIWLAFDRTDWRPTYYNMCDEVVARNNKEKIMQSDFNKILAHSVRKYLWEDSQALFVNPKRSKDDQSDLVGWDLVRGTMAGHSVVNLGLKIAWYMGIREVYIIGCDHNFIVPDSKTGERIMHNEVIVSVGERNHFHPDYRPEGETWTVPKLDTIAQEFAFAASVYEQTGGTIKNASRFSKLDVLERVNFDDIVE